VLALVMLAAFGKLLMVHQALTLSRVVGWSVGLAGVWLLWRLPAHVASWSTALAALLWFSIDELRPFELTDALGEFHWLPFTALLQGSLVANTSALAWHLFWLGAVMLLGNAQGARAAPLAVALSVWALALELLQMLLPGRVADSTPLLLPWVWLLAMPLLHPRAGHPGKPIALAV
jgi:hypothetical protein